MPKLSGETQRHQAVNRPETSMNEYSSDAPNRKNKAAKLRELPLPKLGGLTSSVICSHEPICLNSDACIRRTMGYAMGKRNTP